MAKPIQPIAFTFAYDASVLAQPVHVLTVPHHWRAPLLQLQSELNDREGEANTVATRSLNAATQAFVPYLLAPPYPVRLQKEKGEGLNASWLVARHPLPLDAIWSIFRAWLEKLFQDCASYDAIKDLFVLDDLHWQEGTLAYADATTPNGTASLPPLAYDTVPTIIAELLLDQRVQFPIKGEERGLVRVPSARGAEVMTWPPVYYDDPEGGRWAYSYVAAISLQTIAGQAHPQVYIHYSVRRWRSDSFYFADKHTLYLERGMTTVYLHANQPWAGLPPASVFTQARLVASYVQNQRVPMWADRVPEIAQRLGVTFPQAAELAANPQPWLLEGGVEGVNAAVVTRSTRHHRVQPGLDLQVHEALTQRLFPALLGQVELGQRLFPMTVPDRVGGKHTLELHLRDLSKEVRLQGLVDSVGGSLTVEVYYETPAIRDMLVDRVIALLTLPRPEKIERAAQMPTSQPPIQQALFALAPIDLPFDVEEEELAEEEQGSATLQGRTAQSKPRAVRAEEPPPQPAPAVQELDLPGGGRLRIVTQRLGAMGQPLDPENRTLAAMYTQIEGRVKDIGDAYPAATEPTLALVELPNYQDPQKPELRARFGRRRDPKYAIRLGLARTNRVSQFITDENDDMKIRAEGAVRDGLRHLGYLPACIDFRFVSGHQLPAALTIAAVWFIRLTKKSGYARIHLPVIVLMHTTRTEVEAWLPDGKGVRSYRQALLDITCMKPADVSGKKQWEALRDVQQFLQFDLTNYAEPDILLLTHAQNARATWRGVANGQIEWDKVRFEAGVEGLTLQSWPRHAVRLVRLRTSDQHETPEYYVANAHPSESTQGIWPLPGDPRHYFNIGSKPHSMRAKRQGKQVDPTEYIAIPSIVEILTIAAPNPDEYAFWPKAIDQWRRMSYLDSEGDMTLLPLPLEFAAKMDEYARVIGPWVLPREWDEEDEEDEDDTGVVQLSLFGAGSTPGEV